MDQGREEVPVRSDAAEWLAPRQRYADAAVRLYQGDCLSLLPALADASVDAVITDPPYSSGGAFRADRVQSTTIKYVQTGQQTQYGDFAGDNRDQRAYGYWCALWLAECLRLTRPGGVCCLFTDWRQLPTTADALQAGGWIWRGVGVWDKTEGTRPQKGRFRSQCEYVVWGSRGPMANDGPCLPGLWRHNVRSSVRYHMAAKPDPLMQDLVAICPPGGVVLDPFAGSGSTLLACRATGRRAIGLELQDHWCDVIHQRLTAAVPAVEV